MEIFNLISLKIITILISVVIGFLAGKLANVQRESIAALLFYFIAPIVFFSTPASSELKFSTISVMIIVYCTACTMCFIAYHLYGLFFKDVSRNILAMSAGTCNSGYFMLPIAAALFDEYTLSIYMMAIVGVNVYESSVGFYIGARSVDSVKDSLKRVMKLPNLNAFVLGCVVGFSDLQLPDFVNDFVQNMRVTYSILGMIMIGLGISRLKKFELDFKFTLAAFLSKFVIYPLVISCLILLDKWVFCYYDSNYYKAFMLLSTAPMAANTIVVSSIVNYHPERVAAAVLLSVLFVVIYMPVFLSIVLPLLD